MAGYHLTGPTRGEFGELSKVFEELEELVDADAQGAQLILWAMGLWDWRC